MKLKIKIEIPIRSFGLLEDRQQSTFIYFYFHISYHNHNHHRSNNNNLNHIFDKVNQSSHAKLMLNFKLG